MSMIMLKQRAVALVLKSHTLFLAGRDPRTPWYTKALAATVAAYTLSPVDFIPMLGYQ